MKPRTWKSVVFLLVVSLFALAVRAAASGANPVSLLMVSDWAYQEIPEGSDGTWLGVFEAAGGSVLRRTQVRIEANEELGEKKARVDARDTPLFLVRGLENAQPGSVPTARVQGPENPGPGQRVTLTLGGAQSALYIVARPGEEEAYSLVLESGKRRQVLYESYGWSEGRLKVIWAGDLDRDGRLDLVVDYSEHYAGSSPTLFLSSRAGSGDLVGEAADFQQSCC
jgi:hypothetical protein